MILIVLAGWDLYGTCLRNMSYGQMSGLDYVDDVDRDLPELCEEELSVTASRLGWARTGGVDNATKRFPARWTSLRE